MFLLNLTVGFLRHSDQYGHYFIRQLSAATRSQFTVLTWPTVLTAHWCGEVTTESDEWQLRDKIMLTRLICVCVCVGTVNGLFIYRAQKGKFYEKGWQNFPTQKSSPNFKTKNVPDAQCDAACNTSASCSTAATDMTTADSVTLMLFIPM